MTKERLEKINGVAEDIRQLEDLYECIDSGTDMRITFRSCRESYFECPFWLKAKMLSVISVRLDELRREFETL